MSEPFIGEIRMFSFNYPPRGWALCNGQLLPIAQNQALFSILGTTFGGNGQTTFALPELRGRAPLHVGPQNPLGTRAGATDVSLTVAELPPHTHELRASAEPATLSDPGGAVFAKKRRFGADVYAAAPPSTPLAPAALQPRGGSQPHTNLQPYGVVSICIALQGIYPSRN